jgi:hypothetical protein
MLKRINVPSEWRDGATRSLRGAEENVNYDITIDC